MNQRIGGVSVGRLESTPSTQDLILRIAHGTSVKTTGRDSVDELKRWRTFYKIGENDTWKDFSLSNDSIHDPTAFVIDMDTIALAVSMQVQNDTSRPATATQALNPLFMFENVKGVKYHESTNLYETVPLVTE